MLRADFDGTFDGWREVARRLLAAKVAPERIAWRVVDGECGASRPGELDAGGESVRVSRQFLLLARVVACHRDPGRWALLYRALWRQASGEPHEDDERLRLMARAVRRSARRMKASVRFQSVRAPGHRDPAYVAWCEPAHLVVEATAPFFVRRFSALRWSILTPDRCAHWDRRSLRFTAGADRRVFHELTSAEPR